MDNSSRSFTVEAIMHSGKKLTSKGGRYISSTPAGAAKKAFSHHSKAGHKTLEIHLKETTKDSKHKVYKYKVSKVKEDTDVKRGDTTIHFSYKTKVKAV